MMEAEGEFTAAALRFSSKLAQRDFQVELLRLYRSYGWARALPAMRLRVLKAHKDRCTFEVSLDTENGWQSLIGKVHDVDRSDVVAVMESIVDAGFGPTSSRKKFRGQRRKKFSWTAISTSNLRPRCGAEPGWVDFIRGLLDRGSSRSPLNSSTRSVIGRSRSGPSEAHSASRPRCYCEIWKRLSRRLAASNRVRATVVTCPST